MSRRSPPGRTGDDGVTPEAARELFAQQAVAGVHRRETRQQRPRAFTSGRWSKWSVRSEGREAIERKVERRSEEEEEEMLMMWRGDDDDDVLMWLNKMT